jgi:hypothetical protein
MSASVLAVGLVGSKGLSEPRPRVAWTKPSRSREADGANPSDPPEPTETARRGCLRTVQTCGRAARVARGPAVSQTVGQQETGANAEPQSSGGSVP